MTDDMPRIKIIQDEFDAMMAKEGYITQKVFSLINSYMHKKVTPFVISLLLAEKPTNGDPNVSAITLKAMETVLKVFRIMTDYLEDTVKIMKECA